MIESVNTVEVQKQKLQDFNALADLMAGKISMDELDYDLKVRLINICNERSEAIKLKVEKKKKDIKALEEFLYQIKRI